MYEQEILKKAQEINEELIRIRRDIHAHPELGFEEKRTSELVACELKKLGLEVKTNVGITGVVGLLRGSNPGKTVLLRADMDCLKIEEQNDVEYKSQNKGLMHACGHDAHTTWLLGAAMILSEFRDKINGNIKFLFQPAEEFGGGALKVIEEGVLENPHVDAAFGAHIWPTLEDGKIGIKEGPLMAATDFFELTIHGKGGHGAQPDACIDPIAIGCQVYNSLQTIVSRRVSPFDSVVLTIGKFCAGSSYNIIPDNVEMAGTVRTLNEEVRKKMPKMIENIIKGLVEANDASYEFEYQMDHPCVMNEKNMNDIVAEAASSLLGKETVKRLEIGSMTGEDFAHIQSKVPGAFFWVGTHCEEKGLDKPLHNCEFKIDENMIHKASAVLAECALRYLSK